jgi:hypothetical protein
MASEAELERPAGAPLRRLSVRGLLAGMADSFRRGRPRLWWAAAFIAAALGVAIYLGYHQARAGTLGSALGLGLVRLLIALLGMAAVYRAILRPETPLFRIDGSTFRFIGGSMAIFAFIAGFLLLARLWVFNMTAAMVAPAETKMAFRVVSLTVVAVLLSCAFIRTQPWLAALAAGRRDLGPGRSWAETSGSTQSMVSVWLICVLPLMILNVIFSLLAGQGAEIGPAHAAYAMLEALGVTAIAVATGLLNATVLRWIDGDLNA